MTTSELSIKGMVKAVRFIASFDRKLASKASRASFKLSATLGHATSSTPSIPAREIKGYGLTGISVKITTARGGENFYSVKLVEVESRIRIFRNEERLDLTVGIGKVLRDQNHMEVRILREKMSKETTHTAPRSGRHFECFYALDRIILIRYQKDTFGTLMGSSAECLMSSNDL